MRHGRAFIVMSALLSVILLMSCGGGSGSGPTPPPPPVISVAVTPGAPTVAINSAQAFSATVVNTSNAAVSWSVLEGTSGGTITSAGMYTASGHAGSYHVVATSQADSTKAGTAVVTVTAPAPVFSSTPPSTAVEGSVYSYAPAATDPSGTSVTFSLTAAPNGASINSGVVQWTPIQSQSRSSNAFTVTATAATGGSVTQQWTVTPTGTILGTRMISYVTDTGSVDQPGDASTFPIAAFVPDGAGFTKINGIGLANGTFSIPNVAPGHYWLKHGSYYYWTNTSAIDTGYDQQGRSGNTPASGSINFNLSGSTVWQDSDELHVYSSNANAWNAYPTPPWAVGTTALNGLANWQNSTIDPAQGDRLYVTHLSTRTASVAQVQALSDVLGPLSTYVGAGTASIGGAMQPVSQTGSIRANIKGSVFRATEISMHPLSVHEVSTFGLDLQPGGESKGWIGSSPDLVAYSASIHDSGLVDFDVDLGAISYGNPYPSGWKPFVFCRYQSYVPYFAQGATASVKVYSYNGSSSTTLPTSTSAFGPLVGPPDAVSINGSSFFNDHSASGLSPNVSWRAPIVGSATDYRLTIYRLSPDGLGGSRIDFIATLCTKGTSLVVPPEVLQSGMTYVFKLASVYLPGRDIERSPYRRAFPDGYAETSSGTVTP